MQCINEFSLQIEKAASAADEIYFLGDFNINRVEHGLIPLKHLIFNS